MSSNCEKILYCVSFNGTTIVMFCFNSIKPELKGLECCKENLHFCPMSSNCEKILYCVSFNGTTIVMFCFNSIKPALLYEVV